MILNDTEVNERLASPLNLINRLKSEMNKGNAMDTFMPPSVDDLIENVEDKLKLGSAHNRAISVLDDCVSALAGRIHEVDKAKDLSRIATDMSKVVNSIDEIRNGRDKKGGSNLVIWQPIIMTETHYEVIQVRE